MLVLFELSMPGRGSWNGKWSGDTQVHAVVRSFRRPPTTFRLGRYTYDFGDGWCEAVTVREITSTAARSIRKESRGFAGYDWMIDEIVTHGRILTLAEHAKVEITNG